MTKKIILTVIVILPVVLYLSNLWMTHFWYRGSDFSVGVKNHTNIIIRGVELISYPKGDFTFGSIAPKSEKVYVDPPWPTPNKISIKWNSGDIEKLKEFPAELDRNFKGEVWIVFNYSDDPEIFTKLKSN